VHIWLISAATFSKTLKNVQLQRQNPVHLLEIFDDLLSRAPEARLWDERGVDFWLELGGGSGLDFWLGAGLGPTPTCTVTDRRLLCCGGESAMGSVLMAVSGHTEK
jgi:hypothetical protein